MSARFQLVAIAFPDEFLAAEAAGELERRATAVIERDAAAVVVCDPDGGRRLTDSRGVATTSAWGELWAGLLGSVRDGSETDGIEPGFCDWLGGVLRPQTSALLVVLAQDQHEAALDILIPLGGVWITSPLPDDFPERWNLRT